VNEAEELYYQCCERIDDDLEIAEEFLVGCVFHVREKFNGRAYRDRIENHFKMANFEPFIREMQFIMTLDDDILDALIATSLDLSPILKKVQIIYEKIEYANYDEVEASVHCNKARRAGNMLISISDKMKQLKKPRHKNLFDK
jgi:hypothetical protein